jgi:hypothetical protein
MSESEHFSGWLDELIQRGKAIPADSQFPKSWRSIPEYDGWAAAVEQFLIELLGPESVYYLRFRDASVRAGVVMHQQLESSLQVLESLRQDLNKGRLLSFRALVTAEVFSDFLDMAEHLLEHGYKDPCASLIGAVLESGLRQIAIANNLSIRLREDLTSLNNRLAERSVYTRLVQKTVSVWIDIRNHADHGAFDQYTLQDVRAMLSGVRDFLGKYP